MSASPLHVKCLVCHSPGGVAVGSGLGRHFLPSVGVGQRWGAWSARGGQAAARLGVLVVRPHEESNPRGHGDPGSDGASVSGRCCWAAVGKAARWGCASGQGWRGGAAPSGSAPHIAGIGAPSQTHKVCIEVWLMPLRPRAHTPIQDIRRYNTCYLITDCYKG